LESVHCLSGILFEIIFHLFASNALFGILSIIFLLAFSAMLSATEVAFFSITPSQLRELKEKNTGNARQVVSLLKNPEKLLAAVLIANNFLNIAIVILSSFVCDSLFDFSQEKLFGFLIQVIAITFLILLFGEIIPKVYAVSSGIKLALTIAYPISLISKILSPLSFLLVKSTSLFNRRFSRLTKKNISVEDLSHALKLTESDIHNDKEILEGIVSFGNIDVSEIMKPRVDVVAAEMTTGFLKLLTIINESGYSRIPVYENNLDNIKGVLYIKDLLPHIHETDLFGWQNLIREPYFVPQNMKINDMLEDFQSKKIHIAIVTDEYGGVSGILSLEDVLEEIVGEIIDESDGVEQNFVKVDETNYLFEAKIQLNDFYKAIDVDDDIFAKIRGDADSLGGLILEIKGEIPKKDDVVEFENFVFTIVSVDNRRIKKIHLKIKEIRE
jgi:gliding motility-associated protein GldE